VYIAITIEGNNAIIRLSFDIEYADYVKFIAARLLRNYFLLG